MSLLDSLINGISLGSIYAIIALGYTMVYGIAKMLNFAHGDVIMVGAYVCFFAATRFGINPLLSVLIAMVVCTLLGITIEKLAYAPLRSAPSLAVLITAIGVSYFLQNLALLLWSPNPKVFPDFFKKIADDGSEITGINLFGGSLRISYVTLVTISFLSGEWNDMMDEIETKLQFRFGRKKYNISEIINLSNTSHNAKKRKKALDELNSVLASSGYANLRARALNLVMGEKNLMDKERGFKSPMEARNISNNLDAKTVDALHTAVAKYGAEQGKRYYNILRKLLHKKILHWSDRNAPLPFESKTYYSWDKCVDTVMNAYQNFSPTLADLIKDSFKNHRIDAPVYKGKTSGAYNYTVVAKGGKVYTWTFLNYLGTTRDVMTLAHELGHSVHGQLAGKKQGTLQAQAPMAYAETASIFGEMLTFEYMLNKLTDKKEKLVLLLSKANDWINSVNRQISFSFFEQIIHEKRKLGKLTDSDFNDAWMKVSKDMYGRDGEVFTYDNMENLWSYVGHFMRPFYVYAYSFGELFTQSLFAVKSKNPKKFEKLYIEMLESGSSKNAVELMKPFGLNPTNSSFWKQGIDISIKKWLDEAEILIKELKL